MEAQFHVEPGQHMIPHGVDRQLTVDEASAMTRTVGRLTVADISTRWSCRSGVCHTFTRPVLSGEVSYDPAPLEPPGAGEALIGCAPPATDIALDT
jgi:hypothetical protein